MHFCSVCSDRFLPDKAIDLIDEAGSKVRLKHAQLPEEARELDKQLRAVTKEKNEAVRGQDFEKVTFVYHCGLVCYSFETFLIKTRIWSRRCEVMLIILVLITWFVSRCRLVS